MVVNPASDNGRTARRWPEIARAAAARGLDLDVRATEAAGHASELTRAALREGAGLIVAVGGDGTVSEVANGFFDGDAAVSPDAELAVIPRGSGCDFVKTFGISKRVDRAVATPRPARRVRTIDLGRVRFTDWDGAPGRPHLLQRRERRPDRGRRRPGQPVGEAARGHDRLRMGDDRDVRRATATAGSACGSTSASSTRSATTSSSRTAGSTRAGCGSCRWPTPSDGLLDVLVWGDVGKADLARNLHRLYRGTHIGHPKADISRARRITVEPDEPASDRSGRRDARPHADDVRGRPGRASAARAC